jgi:hypothetical protein
MLQRAIATIRQLLEGVGRPTASSCSGDPIAAQKDAERQFKEREAIRNVHGAHASSSASENTSPDSRRAAVP